MTKLTKNQVADILKVTFPEYKGRTYRASETSKCYCENIWGGGTRDYTKAVKWNGRSWEAASMPRASFGDIASSYPEFDIPADVLIVKHSFFCGKDMGIVIEYAPNCIYTPRLLA